MLILEHMLKKYKITSTLDKVNVLKEIIQEVVLSGLARSSFFSEAAFYGGTALRIFHQLDRFSEDLDFTLLKPNSAFDIGQYMPGVLNELASLGLKAQVETKEKVFDSPIQSRLTKGKSHDYFLICYPQDKASLKLLHPESNIKVKIEIDIQPPPLANTSFQQRLLPYPYQVRLYDLTSLFASKLDAVLRRNWQTRVKGRDWYDMLFFIAKDVPVNLVHLQARLIQGGLLNKTSILNRDGLMSLLVERIEKLNIAEAKIDITPFIKDLRQLTLWSAAYFKEKVNQIIIQ